MHTPTPRWTPLTGAAHAVALEVLLHGPLPRSELARRLGLSAGSLTRLAKPLIDSGLLVEADANREARNGRPTLPLDVVPESHHFIGVKVTAEDVHAVVTTLRAETVASVRAELSGREPADVVATVRRLVGELSAAVPSVTAAGVSLGGRVRDHAVVTRAPLLGWTGDVPLAALLADAVGMPVYLDNDLLALTRAEHWFGAGRGQQHFAVLTVGAGVGYGLVMHDRIVDTLDAGLGLVGHHPLDPLGPLCPEGHRGCATAMLSIPGIRNWTSIGLGRSVGYEECLDLAEAGHPVALPIIRDSGRALGRLIAAVANFTLSRKIILTGEGIRLATVAAEAVAEGLRADRDPSASWPELDILPGDFMQWARGAAVTAIQNVVSG